MGRVTRAGTYVEKYMYRFFFYERRAAFRLLFYSCKNYFK